MIDFERLVDDHYEALYRFAMSLTRNPDRSADLVQETFCIWAAKGSQLREASKAKSWLFTTLHREFLANRRRAARFTEDAEAARKAIDNSHSDDEEADRQMDGQRALELLGDLDDMFRAPLSLFYLQQHSYKEIAEILEIPIGTVMSRISRGKEILRRKMTADPASAPKNILHLAPDTLRKSHG
ncbi:MAG: RNA polymerase sigma factor [Luteolibacter sp.]|jgi:RNA polymerase sigma factor (sigma-70 family)